MMAKHLNVDNDLAKKNVSSRHTAAATSSVLLPRVPASICYCIVHCTAVQRGETRRPRLRARDTRPGGRTLIDYVSASWRRRPL